MSKPDLASNVGDTIERLKNGYLSGSTEDLDICSDFRTASSNPFRFQALPLEIRRKIYDFAAVRVVRPLLPGKYTICFEDLQAPVAFLACRQLVMEALSETKALRNKTIPVFIVPWDWTSLLYPLSHALDLLLRALDDACGLDASYTKIAAAKNQPSDVRKVLREAPLKRIFRQISWSDWFGKEREKDDEPLTSEEQDRFEAFVGAFIRCMRRKAEAEIRVMVRDLSDVGHISANERKDLYHGVHWFCDLNASRFKYGHRPHFTRKVTMVCANTEMINMATTLADPAHELKWEIGNGTEYATVISMVPKR